MGFRFRRSIRSAPGVPLNVRRRRWGGAFASGASAARRWAGGGPGSIVLSVLAAGIFFGMISSLLESTAEPGEAVASESEGSAEREAFYLHGAMNVRTGPSPGDPVTRTLSSGERVELGPKDEDGWARVYASDGEALGYLYRASDLVRSSPPAAEAEPASAANGGS